MDSTIIIDTREKITTLKLVKEIDCNFKNEDFSIADVFIGRNGVSSSKVEGDGKTPLGTFEIGIVFGMHDKETFTLDDSLEYIKINKNLYWIDDISSKYYNMLVDDTKVAIDWKSAEHLADYPVQYEYAIEIKANPNNIPGKGSAIFIHCSNGKSTAGCIAIPKEKMIELLSNINKNTKIVIK